MTEEQKQEYLLWRDSAEARKRAEEFTAEAMKPLTFADVVFGPPITIRSGTTIAFECPEHVKQHPDVRLEERVEYCVHPLDGTRRESDRAVQKAWMQGCKKCQQTLSNCSCGEDRVESELLIYDRDNGQLGRNYMRFFKP